MMSMNRLKVIAVAMVLFSFMGTGVGMMAPHPQAAKDKVLPIASDKPLSVATRVDLHGDPLPEGAVMRLGTLQRRAVGATIAVSADGQSIVTVRGGKYVRIWDAATGKLRQQHTLPVDAVTESVLSTDGRWLLTGLAAGEDHVLLWDTQTGKRIRTLTIDKALNIGSAVFSADGKTMAAAGAARNDNRVHHVRVWELATGKVVFQKDVQGGQGIRRLLFTPNGKQLLASATADPPYLICWDLDSGDRLWSVPNLLPYALVCSSDGELLCSDTWKVLNLATGQRIPGAQMPLLAGERILRMILSPDERTLFASTFTKVIVWDRVHGKVLRTLTGTGGEQIALWPDGKSILTNSAALQRWDVESGKPLYPDTFAWGHTGAVRHLVWSANGRRLASDAEDGTLRVWDAVTGRPLHFQRDDKKFRVVSANSASETGDEVVALSPDGRVLLTNAVGAGCLKMWQAETGKAIRSLTFPAGGKIDGPQRLFRARISTDGARVIALLGSQSFLPIKGETPTPHQVVVWDAKTGERVSCQPIGWTQEGGTALAPDGRTFVASGVLRDVASGKELARLQEMGEYLTGVHVAFSHDGALVVGESSRQELKDKTVYIFPDGLRVWETATGKTVAHLKTKSWVNEVAFHPNNRFIATNDRDGIQIWDVTNGQVTRRLRMPEIIPATPTLGSFASCPSFAVDGRLATGHPDGTLLVWNVPLPPSISQRMQAKELETLWTDLAGVDAAKAWRAVWRMADAPQAALAFLRGRVKPYPTAPAGVTRQLLADLDSDSFQAREAAVKRLKELGLQAEPALRAALANRPSLEQRRRIEDLLAALLAAPTSPTAEELRQLRALIVLERLGTPEARRILGESVKGPPSARLTRQARAALRCLPQ